MAENKIDEQLGTNYSDSNFSGVLDSETNYPYPTKGAGTDHFVQSFARIGFHVNEHIRAVRGFRIYQDDTLDGALDCSITAGRFRWNGADVTYAGENNKALTDDVANYIYYDIKTSAIVINTTGFPTDPAFAPHLPIATITPSAGAWRIDTGKSDYRERSVFTPYYVGPAVTLKYEIKDTDFSAAGLTETINLLDLPTAAQVVDVFSVLIEAFTGTGPLTDLDFTVGSSEFPGGADPDAFTVASTMNLVSDSLNTIYRGEAFKGAELKTLGRSAGPYDMTAAMQIEAAFTAVGGNLDVLTAGQVDIYIVYRPTG